MVYFMQSIELDLTRLSHIQVSHHPAILACHCEGNGWRFWGETNLKSKFWGRSIQLDPVGLLNLQFVDGEIFQWNKVHVKHEMLYEPVAAFFVSQIHYVF